jgi:hypothetical protein
MKIIFRIIMILAAAMMIGGALYAMVDRGGSSSPQTPAFENGDRPEGFPPSGEFVPGVRPERDGPDGASFLPAGVLKSLLIISIVSVIYLTLGKWIGKFRRQAASR